MPQSGISVVRSYHDRTKHHLHRYAASLGYLDWASQPNPFRFYDGAPRVSLAQPPLLQRSTYDELFNAPPVAEPFSFESVSRLFFDSLAISAWKQAPRTNPWSLRINPSSGALQPTESYLIIGPTPGISASPAVFHYNVYLHALEKRIDLTDEDWQALTKQTAEACLFVALASIWWRESWKYGERAFRYCHHDVGHAIGTVAFAGRALGWQTQLLNSVADDDVAVLLGIHQQHGVEAEHPDCLLALSPSGIDAALQVPRMLIERLRSATFLGQRNVLSKDHHAWPIIDEIGAATRHAGRTGRADYSSVQASLSLPDRDVAAQQVIRQRRSAVDMDGKTAIARNDFYRMMARTLPHAEAFPFSVLPWRPRVSLAVFVHRVSGLERGLYLLIRHASHRAGLLTHLRQEFIWQKPADCPAGLELYLLTAADTRKAAKLVICEQDIAADGAFSLGMLAEFDRALEEDGSSAYPRLFWETGLIGQVLYLEAEAAGIRSTGIGCFFDDAMHDVLGIKDHSWQSLYHFTVGGAVDDPRLKTIAPYAHLKS